MYQYDTHTARKPGSLFWCYALMSMQFTPVLSYARRGIWSNLRAVCSTVGLYCVTKTCQQIFKGSLQVTVESVLPHVTNVPSKLCAFGRAHSFKRLCTRIQTYHVHEVLHEEDISHF